MAPAFSDAELAYMEAHKDDTRVPQMLISYSIPIAAGALSTIMRLWAKRYGRNGITLDDYFIVIATLCLVGQCTAILILGPSHGMGRHVIVVSHEDQKQVRKGDFIFSHFYDIALTTVKLAILAFYHRIFVHPLFRKVVEATGIFILLWGVGITVTLFLACRPLAYYWNQDIPGKCLAFANFVYFTNISNLITDIWIFLLPIPMIWQLQLQTKKKLLLSLIFCVGLATCVISSIRLTVVLGRVSSDFTWNYVPLGAYSIYEPLGGILCTNLPIIWHMFKRHKATTQEASFKSHSNSKFNSAHTIGSRRQRVAARLGITTHDRTVNETALRTDLGQGAELGRAGDFRRLESMESQVKPGPQIWATVEKMDGEEHDEPEDLGESGIPLRESTKKTVWNVRK